MAYFGDGSNLSGVSGIPTGLIAMWSGATNAIPSGWALCDGNNSTPDLRNKFIVGANTSTGDTSYPGVSPGATGGSADAVLVSHTHNLQNHVHGINLTTNNPGDHDHNVDVLAEFASTHGTWQTGGGYRQVHTGGTHRKPITSDAGGHTHTLSGNTGTPSTNTTDTLGESATNKNLPPYYALAYIIQYAQGGTTAKGQKGEQGATGSGGSTGDKGQKGEVGATGSGGSTGSTGAKGQKGEIGTTGDKGQKGEIGSTGSTGSAGSDGSDGAKGQKGEDNSTKGQKGEEGAQGSAAATVKHVRQTSNYEISTGNTSWGVAGSMQMSITAPSNNCLIFYAYNLSFSAGGSGGGEGNSYRGRVFVNGSYSHNFIGQVQGGSISTNLSATFQNEGYSGSTYYSANDTITVQVEIRNLDSGTGNKTRINSGSYLTVLAFATS